MAFHGVPNETRKSFENGTTIFERVLPGADRMYPDTDSAPIPWEESYINEIAKRIPVVISERYKQLAEWNVPADTYTYILKNNMLPLVEKIYNHLKVPPRFTCTLLAHTLKHIRGQFPPQPSFTLDKVYDLIEFLVKKKMDPAIAKKMLFVMYEHPKMDAESVLVTLGYKEINKEELLAKIPFLEKKYLQTRTSTREGAGINWVMGNLSKTALGNMPLAELRNNITLKA